MTFFNHKMKKMNKLVRVSHLLIYATVFLSAYVLFYYQYQSGLMGPQKNRTETRLESPPVISNNNITSDKSLTEKATEAPPAAVNPESVIFDTMPQLPVTTSIETVSAPVIEDIDSNDEENADINTNLNLANQEQKRRLKEMNALVKNINDNYTDSLDSNTINELWKTAADVGIPDNALDALKLASQSRNEAIAKLASQALNDLNNVRDNKPNKLDILTQDLIISDPNQTSQQIDTIVDHVENEGEEVVASTQLIVNKDKATQLVSLSQYGDDEDVRQAARDALIGHRLPQAVDMMEQSFATLEEGNRVTAVESLWHLAADNVERERAILLLESAALDTHIGTAELAQRALHDLRNPPEPTHEEAHPEQVEHDGLETEVIE